MVVQDNGYGSRWHASSVLILEENDGYLGGSKENYWLAKTGTTTGQGFTMRVDDCARMIAGVDIKNTKNLHKWATQDFKVTASLNKEGPWETVLDARLPDTLDQAAELLNFTFQQPTKLKYLRFELISYWGTTGGGLQYFAPIPSTSECATIN